MSCTSTVNAFILSGRLKVTTATPLSRASYSTTSSAMPRKLPFRRFVVHRRPPRQWPPDAPPHPRRRRRAPATRLVEPSLSLLAAGHVPRRHVLDVVPGDDPDDLGANDRHRPPLPAA